MYKILLVQNNYQIGGGEHTVFANEKELLEQNGHQVYVYTRSNLELKKKKWLLFLLPFSQVFSCKSYRDISKLIREKEIDIVHCHNIFPLISPSAYLAAHKLKVSVVQTIHNYRWICPCGLLYREGQICEDCLAGSLLPALKHKCYRNSRLQTLAVVLMLWIHRALKTLTRIHLLFLTEMGKQKYEKVYTLSSDKVFQKPNLCPAPVVDRDCTMEIDINKFVFVGRLEEYKGICFLLDIWHKVPNAELYIYGDGPLRAQVEQAAAYSSRIHYFGFCERENIQQDVYNACAVLFPSTGYEMFPLSIGEAYALGTPVICCDIGNQATLVLDGETGYKYRLGSQDGFLRAIVKVRKNNEKMRKAAKAYWEKYLSPEKNYMQLLNIYKEVLSLK